MAKSKNSKILAMALCASVMAGIYATPVMAAEVTVNSGNLNGVTTSNSSDYTFTGGKLDLDGEDIAGALKGQDIEADSISTGTITVSDPKFPLEDKTVISAGRITIGETQLDGFGLKTANIDATSGKIGGVTIDDGLVDGVDVKAAEENIQTLNTNTQNMTAIDGITTFAGDVIVTDSFNVANGSFTADNTGIKVGENFSVDAKTGNVTANTYNGVKLGVIDNVTRVRSEDQRGDIYVQNGDDETTKVNVSAMDRDVAAIDTRTEGIERIQDGAGNNITEIENTLRIYDNGTISTVNGAFRVNPEGNVFANAVNIADGAIVMSENSINAFENKFTVNTDGGITAVGGANIAEGMFTATAGGITMANNNLQVDTEGNVILAEGKTVDGVDVSKLSSAATDITELKSKTQNINLEKTKTGETVFNGKVVANKFGTSNDSFYVTEEGQLKANSIKINKGEFEVAKDGTTTATNFVTEHGDFNTVADKTAGISLHEGNTTYFTGAIAAKGDVKTTEYNGFTIGEQKTVTSLRNGDLYLGDDEEGNGIHLTKEQLANINGVIKENGTVEAKELSVAGETGGLYVKDVEVNGKSATMIFTRATNGDDTMWIDPATGNLSTAGTISVGGLENPKTVIDGDTGSIAIGVGKGAD